MIKSLSHKIRIKRELSGISVSKCGAKSFMCLENDAKQAVAHEDGGVGAKLEDRVSCIELLFREQALPIRLLHK